MVRKKPIKEPAIIKQSADDALIYAENIIDTVREPLIALDQDLRVVKVSRSFYEFFKVKPEYTVGQLIYDLGNRQWDIPKLRELLETILPQQTAFDNYEVEHDFATIGRRIMLLNARRIPSPPEKPKVILLAIEDITDRRKAEKVLMERANALLGASEERYRLLVENINDILCMLDTQGNVTYISPVIERVTKHKISDIIGKRFIPIVYPDDASSIEDNLNRLASGQLESWEFRIMDKDGTVKFVRSSSRPIYEDGQIEGYATLMTDITERKRMEDALRKSEELFRVSQEMSPDGFTILHPLRNEKGEIIDFTWVYENKTIARINGTDPEEVKGKRMLDLFPTHKGTSIFEAYICVSNSGKPQIIEEVYVGEIVSRPTWLRLVIVSIGEDIAILAQDITEHKIADKALKESEETFKAMVETMPMAIYLSVGVQQISEYISPTMVKLFGYTMEDIPTVAQWWSLAYPDENYRKQISEEWTGKIKRAIETQSSIEPMEVVVTCKDGSKKNILWGYITMGDKNYAFGLDLTERKLSEEKLVKSYASLKKTLNDAIDTMAKIVETRDPYTAGHQHKVADLAIAIAREMKLGDTQIDQLSMAAVIHDIGKMYVPSDILSKPGRLSDIEFSLIKTHPQSGYDIIKGMDFPCNIAKAVLQHHERLDGSGYPNQLKGEDTLLEAKILAVADVIEAMASHRPYRPALGIDKALEEITRGKGKLYDTVVVDACLEIFNSGKFEFIAV